MKVSFKIKVLLTILLSCIICTLAAIVKTEKQLENESERLLIEKSRAILSRLEVGKNYVASMGTLSDVIADTLQKFPDGNISNEQKEKILKSVPVYAAFKLGEEGAEKEHYRFRVFSDSPRNSQNKATSQETEYLEQFKNDPKLEEIVKIAPDYSSLSVIRPVRLTEQCLTCHGHPSKSPYQNEKDILGIKMEDMKVGDLKGAFAIESSLAPVSKAVHDATQDTALWGFGFALVTMGLGFAVVRKPIANLIQTAENLERSERHSSELSSQISQISQTLSENATEAASSLEETVASIEELNSMVSRNAEGAKAAATLSIECQESANRGESEVKLLAASMKDINESSKKIQSILDIIDDMAFQTNLLALNAAVEAARAGEQGKGFAVVAEAVRSLAQKSTSAAKDISALVKDSVSKVEEGTLIANRSEKVLSEITQSVRKVVEYNNSISAASNEQAIGIEQISKAMAQIDSATQQNASASEHAAKSSCEMQDQSESVKQLVENLHRIISGA